MVFENRKFIVVSSHTDNPAKHDTVVNLLKTNGGEIVNWDERADGDVSPKLIIVASSADYERAEEMRRFMIPTVTEAWVYACIQENKLVPMKPYSPDPRNFMKDVIACFSDLSAGDTDVFKAGILASGGECSDIVTRYTSHVVATKLDTPECNLVLQSQKNNNAVDIKLVRPEWIDACMSLKVKVDDTPYLLTNDSTEMSVSQTQDLTGTFPIKDSPRLAVQQSMREGLGSEILDGRRFYLGGDLDLSPRVGKTVNYLIELNGGVIASQLEDAQVYIGKWREGAEYIDASKRRLIVGNITWLYWVMIHQKFEKPNHLLHYPEVKGGLASMRNFNICITNYTGDARAYLQSLIISLGATYSGKLIENHSTHLITAYESGQKYEAAKRWGIPIVNHLWLEDSYAYWQAQDHTSRLYTYFSPKLSMSKLIGTRNLVANVLNKFQHPEELNRAREHHAKRNAKMRAANWLHDAMIQEGEFHDQLKKGKPPILPDEAEAEAGAEADTTAGDSSTAHKRSSSSGQAAEPKHKSRSASPAAAEQPAAKKSKKAATKQTGKPTAKPTAKPAHEPAAADQPVVPVADEPVVLMAAGEANKPTANPDSAGKSAASESQVSQLTKSGSNVRIMFSGVEEPPSNKACARLGLSVVKTPPVQVLIAPRFLKTVKFLQALACAEEFVKPTWIEASIRADTLLPTDNYRIQDEQLNEALAARKHLDGRGFLEGRVFYLDPGLKDKAAAFKDLVKAHKGTILPPRSAKLDSSVTVIGENEDQVPFTKFIESIQHLNLDLMSQK